jgi:ACS family tartrate transporter-like MFS transporter
MVLTSGPTAVKPAHSSELMDSTLRRVSWRLVPFLAVLFLVSFIDRTNVGFAALRMQTDLGLSPRQYGLAAGIFFIGYFAFEVPSNIALYRVGARRWLARIMLTWGAIALAMAFVHTATQFIVLRFLLGVAEAGFYPGVVYYLSLWFPASHRAYVTSLFYLGVPIAQVIGAPLSTGLIEIGDGLGFVGWRLMYLVEGILPMLLAVVTFFFLTDRPAAASWLSSDQRGWLQATLEAESAVEFEKGGRSMWPGIRTALSSPIVYKLALIYFGITCGSNAMNFFLPNVLQEFGRRFNVHYSLLTTGALTAIPYAFAAAAMLIWSRRSDRTGERRHHAGGAALIAAAGIVLAAAATGPWTVMIGFTLLAAGAYAAINVFWSIPTQTLSGPGAAVGIGMINSVGNLSGFAATNVIAALYAMSGSYAAPFALIACVVFAAGASLMRLRTVIVSG